MKQLIKKLAMFLMTLTLVLGLSACSVTFSTDDENQEQQTTTTQPTNPDNDNNESGNTEGGNNQGNENNGNQATVTDDQHIQTLQAAWQNMTGNCSVMKCTSMRDEPYGWSIVSVDYQKGIGYTLINSNNYTSISKVFQESEQYIYYDYYDEILSAKEPSAEYRLVDQSFFENYVKTDLNDPFEIGFKSVFSGTLDSEIFLNRLKNLFGEWESATVDYTFIDGVLTVTVSVDRVTEYYYKSYTAVIKFIVENGVLTSLTFQNQTIYEDDRIDCTNYQINYNVFDQAGFDQIDVGELPENIEPYNPEA